MALSLKGASSSGVGGAQRITGTTSGTADTIHTADGSSAVCRVSLWLRNIGSTAQSAYVRFTDGTSNDEWQEFQLPAFGDNVPELGSWVLQEVILIGDGTAAPKIEAYADTTDEIEYMLTVVQDV